ncbi:unnamed protein product [Caretta caretta]
MNPWRGKRTNDPLPARRSFELVTLKDLGGAFSRLEVSNAVSWPKSRHLIVNKDPIVRGTVVTQDPPRRPRGGASGLRGSPASV